MSLVTYRGPVEELQGQQVEVPASVISAGQAASWIESTWREEQARLAAIDERQRREQELLTARLDQQRQQAAAQAQADQQQMALSDLEAGLRSELTDLSQSVMAAGGAIVGKAEVIEAQTRDWEARHEALVATSEERLATVEQREVQMLAMVEVAVEDATLGEQQREERFAAAQADLRKQVLSQVGPQGDKGERGMAGAGFAYVDTDPTRIDPGSLGRRYFGRPVVPGDMVMQRTPDSLKIWRTSDGKAWKQIDEVVNRQELVSQQLAVSDHSTRVFPTVSTAAGGTGGGGLADPLTVSIIPKGASVAVADSSRWQAGGYGTFTSGIIHLEFVPNQGLMGGRHHFVTASFVLLATPSDSFKTTEFSVLGAGFEGGNDIFDVTFNGALGAATAPSSLGISLPAGTQNATRLFVTITAADPATRDFTIKGNVIWTPEAATGTQLPNLPARKQPAWLLVS